MSSQRKSTLSPEALREVDVTLLEGAQKVLTQNHTPYSIYRDTWKKLGSYASSIRLFTSTCGESWDDGSPHGDMVYIEYGLTIGMAACYAAFEDIAQADRPEMIGELHGLLLSGLSSHISSFKRFGHTSRFTPVESIARSGDGCDAYIDRAGYIQLIVPATQEHDPRGPIELMRSGFAYVVAIGGTVLASRQIFFLGTCPLAEVTEMEQAAKSFDWSVVTPEDFVAD